MTRLLLAILAVYKRWFSPLLHALSPGGCKFVPTCSEYAAEAVAAHGPWRGSVLAAWRLLRCHPFTRGGFDPVPMRTGSRAGILESAQTAPAHGHSARPFPPQPLP
jgi:uncharacterized protein